MKQRVLITGSSGMLGVDLCRELGDGYEVYGIDNRSRAGLNLPYRNVPAAQRYFMCDITDKVAVTSTIDKLKPDVVIHTAAWTDVDGCELDEKKAIKINFEGTENIASACKRAGSTLIYISTDFVFDGEKKAPYKETDRPGPLSIYAKSKLKGEESIKGILKNYFILRTSWLYGKYGKNFVDTIRRKAESAKELRVVRDQIGSPTYTVDLARAIYALLDRVFVKREALSVKRHGIYHVSNSGSVSWYKYAGEIVKLAGCKTEVVPITSRELGRPAKRPAMSILDNSKFTAFTGYEMRDWKAALKEYLDL